MDFSFDEANQRSIDIKAVLTDRAEKVTEIKSGENFKADKRKKESSEIRDAFIEMVSYPTGDGDTRMAFVMTPQLQGKVMPYWQNLSDLRDTPSLRSPVAIRTSKWLYTKLQLPQFPTHESLYDFVKQVEITCGYSDVLDNDNAVHCPIDTQAIQKIRELAAVFGADSTETELPSELLYHQMLHCCQKYAGTNKDICRLLTELILEFFARRRMISRRRSGDYYIIHEQVKNDFKQWWSGTSDARPPTGARPAIATESEGGVIDE